MPKRLHLFDRATGEEVPLPGIDVYMNPGGLTVQTGGHGDEETLGNGHVRLKSRGTGAIEDDRLADEQIVHYSLLSLKLISLDKRAFACQQLSFRPFFLLTSVRDGVKKTVLVRLPGTPQHHS